MTSYHQVLGVDENASVNDIKLAYRMLAKKFHPDLHPDDQQAERAFKEISLAYTALKAEHNSKEGNNDWPDDLDIDEALSPFFEMAANREKSKTLKRACSRPSWNIPVDGDDVNIEYDLDIDKAYSGTLLSINSPLNNEPLTIRVPRGISHGSKMRVKGRGKKGKYGGKNGDVVILVNIIPTKDFSLINGVLHADRTVPFTFAMLGGDIDFTHVDGSQFSIKAPAFFCDKITLRANGKGWPKSNTVDDLLINLTVAYPTKLSSEQIDILKKFAKSEPEYTAENLAKTSN